MGMKNNATIKRLFEADQRVRKQKRIDWSKVCIQDMTRQKKVTKMLEKSLVKTAVDYYHAAMIFQHASEVSGNKVAQRLAKKSMDMGEERAKWLYAASTDRVLMNQGRKQKFGTQYTQRYVPGVGNKVNRIFELYPYDEKKTDKEREVFNVPTLKEAKRMAKNFS